MILQDHFAKKIRNPITIRKMLEAATVMKITAVKMTSIPRYSARIRAMNDNQRH